MEEKKTQFDEKLIAEIEQLIKEGATNRATIAKGIAKSDAAVSQYLLKKYPGNVEKMEEDLRNYVKLLNQKGQIENKRFDFVETEVVRKLSAVANLCQMKGKIGVCFGAPGIGKSTAVRNYKKTTSGVIVVEPFEKTCVKAVLAQIAEQLKLNYQSSVSYEDFVVNIVKKLNRNKYIIIIDEAENIKIDVLRVLRKIFDNADGACSLLLVGTYELYAKLQKVRCGLPYIASRIGYMEKLDSLGLADIKHLVIQYYPDINDGLTKYIAGCVNYNTRYLQNLLDICYDNTKAAGIKLTSAVVDAAREHLLI